MEVEDRLPTEVQEGDCLFFYLLEAIAEFASENTVYLGSVEVCLRCRIAGATAPR